MISSSANASGESLALCTSIQRGSTGDKRATHASSSADFFFLFVFRQSVECKRDRSTDAPCLFTLLAQRSPCISGAISLLRTIACCAGIRSEATSVLPESQRLRARSLACVQYALSKRERKRIGASTVAPRAFGSTRGILTGSSATGPPTTSFRGVAVPLATFRSGEKAG